LANTASAPPTKQVAIDVLTPRETEVLGLLARGYTNRQIADLLTLSVRTVESHRANLMDKLDLHSRVELVRYATENKLL
jgi:two-component system response regulator NreC